MNWKTSLTGILAAACLIGYKLFTHQPVTMDDLIMAGGVAGIGHLAKDKDVTGGTRTQ